MKTKQSHEDVIKGIGEQLKEIFNSSEQAMYIYLDDLNKICNKKFASMLGYDSPQQWASVQENFPSAFVADKSQQTLIQAYQNAMQKGTGSSLKVEWKKKSSGTIKNDVILVPIAFEGHRMALHFISSGK